MECTKLDRAAVGTLLARIQSAVGGPLVLAPFTEQVAGGLRFPKGRGREAAKTDSRGPCGRIVEAQTGATSGGARLATAAGDDSPAVGISLPGGGLVLHAATKKPPIGIPTSGLRVLSSGLRGG